MNKLETIYEHPTNYKKDNNIKARRSNHKKKARAKRQKRQSKEIRDQCV